MTSRRPLSPSPQAGKGRPRPVAQALGAALLLVALAFLPALAQTAPSFPALSGRVVDAANVLKPEDRAAIEAKLKAHEDKTTDQIVVATIPSLGGFAVEDYANRLFRAWRLGQKDKNNGVLFLVAPSERKVRIEVGYGLEGALTDALSKVIVATAVAPRFKAGDFAGGIDSGIDGIRAVLTGDAEEWQRRARVRPDEGTPIDPVMVLVIVIILIYILTRLMGGGGGPNRYHRTRGGRWIPVPVPIPSGGGWGGGWSGGGGWGGGGGFSGGGGSSGGGGASGDW